MAKFKVWGVDRATRLETELVLDASIEENARAIAEMQGVHVTRVETVTTPRRPSAAATPLPPAVPIAVGVVVLALLALLGWRIHLNRLDGRPIWPEAAATSSSSRPSTSPADDVKVISVDDSWHSQHYQVRLQQAQAWQREWAQQHSPGEVDRARIKIVDRGGNEVGGSRVLAGSMVWVRED